ncbi:GNAT family N-acetyltransferase [Tissierella sp.]|uniref:GNAT family N-acetyltransferase n=1 Tax=Tissierella sp. TaxID=41274 RepID=UPI002857E87B|nr:GNAT family N-acetyltransferase [Tissierella sp.]MDR7855470.1 GNAT family N-acetyltransferase [Tissierella sp.]
MIREILPNEYYSVKKFVEKDIARNYFILLGLTSKKQVYDKIYGEYRKDELIAVLFRRKSGVLQFFAPEEFDIDGFENLISTLEYDALIGPKSYCHKFLDKGLFTSIKDGAYISKLDKDYIMKPIQIKYKMRDIDVDDLDKIVELYKEVFQSFSPREVMEEKLNNNRGRGVCIEEDGEIISVAQTDFEIKDTAVIVGVATNRDYRCKGLATQCLQSLCSILLKEGKDLYLQYDNLEAGKIYEKLGFVNIDQVIHYRK